MRITKEERRIWREFQFLDKHGFFPFEKKKISLTIVGTAIEKLLDKDNKSKFVEELILKN